MKKITLLLSFIACVLVAQGQVIVKENFNYTVGTELKANGWVGTGSTPSTTNPIMVTVPSISYAGYPDSGVGNEISLTTSGEDLNKSYTAITSGTIYYSALVNLSAAQAAGDYFLHIGDLPTGTSYWGRTFAKLDGAKIAFGILNTSGGTTTYTASNYDLNTTYLLVVKFEISTLTASLIVNPAFGSEPTSGWITNTAGTAAFPAAGMSTINVRQGTAANAPTLKLDGIRVSTSWSSITTGISNPVSANSFSAIVSGKNLLVKNVANGSTVEIFSALGNKIQSAKLQNGSIVLNNLSKGLYIVRVGKDTQKIML